MVQGTALPPIPIFIGYDPRECAATNVLIDSFYQYSSRPLAIPPVVSGQLKSLFWRERDTKQSTSFSCAGFLVPAIMGYQGWPILIDSDKLCRGDISELWDSCDDQYALLCINREHVPSETVKFLARFKAPVPKITGAL